jgi:hypothetical protein
MHGRATDFGWTFSRDGTVRLQAMQICWSNANPLVEILQSEKLAALRDPN